MKEFSNHFDMLTEIERLEKENKILKSTISDLLFHLQDYNIAEESFVLAMEIERALEKIKEIK